MDSPWAGDAAALPRCCNNTAMYRQCASQVGQGHLLKRYVGPKHAARDGKQHALRKLLDEKRVLILGDSVSQQWYESLLCYAGLPFSGFPRQLTTRPEHAQLNDWCARIKRVTGALPKVMSSGIYRVGVHVAPTSPRPPRNQVPVEPAGLMFICVTHYRHTREAIMALLKLVANQKEAFDLIVIDPALMHNPARYLPGIIKPIVSCCAELALRCVLREPTPQHFKYPRMEWNAGVYVGKYKHGYCEALPGSTYDSFAAGAREAVLASRGNLSVLPVFDALVTQGDLHPGLAVQRAAAAQSAPEAKLVVHGVDCTHFFGDTELWEPLHLALLDEFGVDEKF